VFERFTERARQVVVLAQDEARLLKHNYIGTEHILLGLLRVEEGVAARVLQRLDITIDGVRGQVARVVGEGDAPTTGQIPFTPRAKKVLELSLREALAAQANYIGAEHILLGLVRENEGVAARILAGSGASPQRVARELVTSLGGQPPPGYIESFSPATSDYGTASERPMWWQRRSPRASLAGSSLLAAVALGVGLLLGWLIWG
jgi:ATP-dependent Clp protease ATP-binding subunit ClpC